jgi:CheY-like chemotaxis protein
VPKILVADDNANIQKMVVLAFEERGIQVVSVGNGEAAVRRIPDLAPDLVLADIFMPVRNGYEVCEFVKKDERFSHVPVILLVGAFDPLDEKEARRVGADGVLKKPFVPPDPLIAMVTSALEKNPKVAAEMAKAREAKLAPPEPELPKIEMPVRGELKPLPEFPEPSAEEAALVYGFGKGVRTLEDEMDAATVAKAPVAEKAEDEDEDDFDAAATTNDWRRNAMDFEVPAEAANKPAFAEDHLDAADFPSESQFPPRRVRASERAEESDPVVQNATPAPPITVPAEPAPLEATVMDTSSTDFSSARTTYTEPAVEEPAPSAPAWAKFEHVPVSQFQAAATDSVEPAPQPAEPTIAAHWMDALSPSQINATGGDWMNSLSSPQASPVSASVPEPISEPAPVEHVMQRVFDHVSEQSSSEPLEAAPVHGWTSSEPAPPAPWTESRQEPEIHAAVEAPAPQDLFPVSHAVHEPEPVVEPAAEYVAPVNADQAETWFAPTPSVFKDTPDVVSETVPVAHSEPDPGLEIDSQSNDTQVSLRDPGLVSSPAVHVTPEPLLVDEDSSSSHGPSEYNSRPAHTQALHSYFSPASGDPVVEEPAANEPSFAAREEMPVPSFAPPAAEEASDESSERIPTGPPPNREALASIPFLTPPPEFRANAPEPAATNSVETDEVVKQILERLQPQLHELLSQGVLKPMIEKLLQKELAKKEK